MIANVHRAYVNFNCWDVVVRTMRASVAICEAVRLGEAPWMGLASRASALPVCVVGGQQPADRPPVEPQIGSHEFWTLARFNPLYGPLPQLRQGLRGCVRASNVFLHRIRDI
jgi:hypothetical protein